MDSITRALDQPIDESLPQLENIYRDLHSHPELAMRETCTARIAAGAEPAA